MLLGSQLGTAKLMRHPDIRTTMNIYADAVTEDMRRATARLEQLVLRTVQNQ
jgi:hypothetical protein